MKKKYYLTLLLLAPLLSHAMDREHHQYVNPFLAKALRHLENPENTHAAVPKNHLLAPTDDRVAFWAQTEEDIQD